jgi:hypothetical protein
MMNMDKVIYIGYFMARYKKNNDAFLHLQHREICPEVIKTYNNRCANLILCNTCPYPDIAKLTVMDDTVKRKLLSSKWNDSHIFKFPSMYIN